MNATGGGNNINTIRMMHQGADVNFNRTSNPCRMWGTGIHTERENYLSLEFQDLYEVENLIHALQEFKEVCRLHTGSWRRDRV